MIDHLGVGITDLAAAAKAYERLGFNLTPYARHEGATTPGGESKKLATANHCAMFKQGYLELIAVVDSALPDNGLGAMINAREGIHIAAFATDDVAVMVDQLRGSGFTANGPVYLERPAPIEGGIGLARFERIMVPNSEMPEARMFYIKHLTPEVLWQPNSLHHSNGTVGVIGITFAVDDPEVVLPRFRRFLAVPDGSNVLERNGSTCMVLSRAQANERYLGLLQDNPPYAVAMTLEVDSITKLRSYFDGAGVVYIGTPNEVLVGPAETCGAILSFVEKRRN